MQRRLISTAALAASAALLAAGAAGAQAPLDMHGVAPLVCRTVVQDAGGGGSDVTAFCNDPEGYSLYVDYPAAEAGETITVNGATVQLTAAGTVQIEQVSGPDNGAHTLAVTAPAGGASAYTVRIAPADPSAYAVASAY